MCEREREHMRSFMHFEMNVDCVCLLWVVHDEGYIVENGHVFWKAGNLDSQPPANGGVEAMIRFACGALL